MSQQSEQPRWFKCCQCGLVNGLFWDRHCLGCGHWASSCCNEWRPLPQAYTHAVNLNEGTRCAQKKGGENKEAQFHSVMAEPARGEHQIIVSPSNRFDTSDPPTHDTDGSTTPLAHRYPYWRCHWCYGVGRETWNWHGLRTCRSCGHWRCRDCPWLRTYN